MILKAAGTENQDSSKSIKCEISQIINFSEDTQAVVLLRNFHIIMILCNIKAVNLSSRKAVKSFSNL